MTTRNNLFEQLVKVTHVYLGPAAERFVARQIQNHLHKEPQELTRDDLNGLIDWIQAAVSLITEDSEIVEEYIGQLGKLAKREHSEGKRG